MRRSSLVLLVALAGCGSAETLPPPEAPSATGELGARLDTRARTLTVGAETVDAGAGPAAVAETRERVYVTDVVQRALLVFEKQPDLHLQRRAYLRGRPTGLALTGERVVVRLADGTRVVLTPGGVER